MRWIFIFNLKHFGTYLQEKQDSMGKTGVKWVREKIQGRLIDDRRWGGRKVSQSSRAVLLQHHQDTDHRENKPRSSVPMLISLHAVWWRHPHPSPSFFPFSALPVVEGVGVTLTHFCHGRSHYHSDHFSLTRCKLQAGSWPLRSLAMVVLVNTENHSHYHAIIILFDS